MRYVSSMLKNYLTVAWRNLRKSKVFSAINVFGLAVGMSVCLLVLTLIRDQDRRDEHHPHAERIYRVMSTVPVYDEDWFAMSPGPLGPALERSAPGVEEVVRIRQGTFNIIHQNDIFSLHGLYAEMSFFTVFDFPLAAGHPGSALKNPYSIVLSHETAQKLFGRADPLGETVTVETNPSGGSSEEVGVFTVTGVLEETDTRSHLAADAYLSFSTLTSAKTTEKPNSWTDGRARYIFGYYTYLLLSEKATPADVETQMNRIIEPHSGDKFSADSLALQPLTGIHLGPDLLGSMERSGIIPVGWLYIMGGLALLILLTAGFNYANLSVARSLTRAREIGVRKTVGASREQVAVQFLGESVLMALIALPIALGLLQGLVPFFNSLQFTNHFQMQVTLEDFVHLPVLLLFVGFAIGVGVLAGAYPALHLSRFDPVRVLKRTGTGRESRSSGLNVRKGLTVLQLGMALCFIVSAVLLYRQANYLARTNFSLDNAERLVYVNLQNAPPQAFKHQAMQLPGVESVSMTSRVPVLNGLGGVGAGRMRRAAERADSARSGVEAHDYWIGADYIENMGLRLVAGVEQVKRAFTDGSSVIINEEAVCALGFGSPAQALGELITYGKDNMRVVGVVENYTNIDLDHQPDPLIHRHDWEQYQYALVRARPGAMGNVTSGLQDLWAQFDSIHPLDYGIYEEALERMTASMVEGVKVLGGAALLTVLIACLGLLGIASYNVRTRTQEIGIRKAFGASVRDVVWLLSKEYLGLVVGAGAFALPLAYWINRQWLTNFAHRIEIGWATPVLSLAALLMLVLAVVGTQTVRAALANPADCLRYE